MFSNQTIQPLRHQGTPDISGFTHFIFHIVVLKAKKIVKSLLRNNVKRGCVLMSWRLPRLRWSLGLNIYEKQAN